MDLEDMAGITWHLERFGELSAGRLYDILRLRAEVFVVDQECVYLDPDGKDQAAFHLSGYMDGKIAAYARIFMPGDYFDDCAIGRFVVSQDHRGTGLGHQMMEQALAAVGELCGNDAPVTISAQAHLEEFYASHGFRRIGDPYMEENIPHVRMRRR